MGVEYCNKTAIAQYEEQPDKSNGIGCQPHRHEPKQPCPILFEDVFGQQRIVDRSIFVVFQIFKSFLGNFTAP